MPRSSIEAAPGPLRTAHPSPICGSEGHPISKAESELCVSQKAVKYAHFVYHAKHCKESETSFLHFTLNIAPKVLPRFGSRVVLPVGNWAHPFAPSASSSSTLPGTTASSFAIETTAWKFGGKVGIGASLVASSSDVAPRALYNRRQTAFRARGN